MNYEKTKYPEANKNLNRDLCEHVANSIDDEPETYDQDSWALNQDTRKLELSCGTPGCVAAHALAYVGKTRIFGEPKEEAASELGLSRDQMNCLFNSSWPHHWFEVDLNFGYYTMENLLDEVHHPPTVTESVVVIDDGPLPLMQISAITNIYGIEPSADHAYYIMRRLAKYGWDGATFSEARSNRVDADRERLV